MRINAHHPDSVLTGTGSAHCRKPLKFGKDRPLESENKVLQDGSGLSEIPVQKYVTISPRQDEAMNQLQNVLLEAGRMRKPVSIRGAGQSMGGQSISENGIVIDLKDFNAIERLPDHRVRVQAGATWKQLLKVLTEKNETVPILQGFHDFSIGGSIGVNAHGWDAKSPPLASAVNRLKVMLADGRIVTCSRQEYPELFRGIIGGYGLLAIVLEAELKTIPNQCYSHQKHILPLRDLNRQMRRLVSEAPKTQLALAHLDISKKNFLNEAILYTLQESKSPVPKTGFLKKPFQKMLNYLSEWVFRVSIGNDWGKRLRWQLEKQLDHYAGITRRDELSNKSITLFTSKDPYSVHVLQEYFIPRDALESFLEKLQIIIPSHRQDLLNATIRQVLADKDSALPYAKNDCFAVVLYFRQHKNKFAETDMEQLTQVIIDATLAHHGAYYLPYRPHATLDQFKRAYPEALDFLKLKAVYDPSNLFKTPFYKK